MQPWVGIRSSSYRALYMTILASMDDLRRYRSVMNHKRTLVSPTRSRLCRPGPPFCTLVETPSYGPNSTRGGLYWWCKGGPKRRRRLLLGSPECAYGS